MALTKSVLRNSRRILKVTMRRMDHGWLLGTTWYVPGFAHWMGPWAVAGKPWKIIDALQDVRDVNEAEAIISSWEVNRWRQGE